MYNVYKVDPCNHYHGMSLIAANSAEEANRYIDEFVASDTHNGEDSWGYEHCNERDLIEGLKSENSGIIFKGIYYYG